MNKRTILAVVAIITLLLTACTETKQEFMIKTVDPTTFDDQTYSPEEIINDIDFMVKTMEEVHPNLYAYRDGDYFKDDIEAIKTKITHPMSKLEVYKMVAPIIHSLKDGHTNLRMPSSMFEKHVEMGFPLDLSFYDGKAFNQTEPGADSSIPLGAEIIAINGQPISSILPSLEKYLSGMRQSYKEIKLETTFDYLLWLEYGYIEEYLVTYLDDDYRKNIVIKEMPIEEKASYQASKTKKHQSFYEYKIEDDICYLDFNSFQDYDAFSKLLTTMFEDIANENVSKLIIDLRDNGGGNSSLGTLLNSYIYPEPFYMFSSVDLKASDQIKGKNMAYNQLASGEVVHTNAHPYRVENLEHLFSGKVILLTNRFTFSSAADFAAAFKDFNVGIIIGEETGGLASAYGDLYTFVTPNLGLACTVSHKFFTRPNGDTTPTGVIPNVIKSSKDISFEALTTFARSYFDTGFNAAINKQLNEQEVPVIISQGTTEHKEMLSNSLNNVMNCIYQQDIDKLFNLLDDSVKQHVDIEQFKSYSENLSTSLGALKEIVISDITIIECSNGVSDYRCVGKLKGEKANYQFSFSINQDQKITNLSTFQ